MIVNFEGYFEGYEVIGLWGYVAPYRHNLITFNRHQL